METVNQGNQGAAAQAAEPADKVFTQAEVDEIVQSRLQRERAKYPDYEALKEKAGKYDAAEEAAKSDLQKAKDRAAAAESELAKLKSANALRDMRAGVAKDTGVPESLLTGATEEECRQQAAAVLAFAKPGYPTVPDKGEASASGKPQANRDRFAAWFTEAF